MLRVLLSVLALVLVAPDVARAENFAFCAWARASPATQADFHAAYRRGEGYLALQRHDAELLRALRSCLNVAEAPPLSLMRGAIGSAANQDGAAAELLRLKGLTRRQLNFAWGAAPEIVRSCFRGNAGKVFGVGDRFRCPDKGSSWILLQSIGIARTPLNREHVTQGVFYYNSGAQGEFAQAFLEEWRRSCRSSKGCPKTSPTPGRGRPSPA